VEENNALQEGLHRGLEERHIQLIALGGAIGVGLFLGSWCRDKNRWSILDTCIFLCWHYYVLYYASFRRGSSCLSSFGYF
jgi:hypothetical protein